MKVELTKDQCLSIADFIEMNLLDAIRKDVDLDNILYVQNLLVAKETLEKEAKELEDSEKQMSKMNCTVCENGRKNVPFMFADDENRILHFADYCPACGRLLT